MKKLTIIFLIIAGLIAKDSFDLRDFYNKSQENSPQSPNDFQMQDVLGKMYPQEVLDSAASENPQNFYDSSVSEQFGPNSGDEDDLGAKGVGNYIKTEKLDIRKKLMQTTKEKLGGIAKSTGRVSCYMTRSQGWFKYHCPINNQDYGFSSSNPTDSPLNAKANCESQCFDPKATACVAVTPLNKTNDGKEVKQKIFDSVFLSKTIRDQNINKSVDKNLKVKYFEFEFKNNIDVYLDFSYEDESGFKRVMAKNLLLKALDDKTLQELEEENSKPKESKEESKEKSETSKESEKTKETKKSNTRRFYINSKVSKVYLNLHIGKLKKNDKGDFVYEDINLDNFSDDDKDKTKKKLIAEFKNGIFFTPETKRFACRTNDVGLKRQMYVKSDLVDLVAQDGTRITLAKSVSSGDNEDGTFSNEASCSATCHTKTECILVQPKLNVEEFFGFKEDCSIEGVNNSQCTKKACIDARENAAPIINEKIYDAEGNAIQTILNGAVVSGVIRPRIIAKDDKTHYEEKIKEEAKDRAYDNMLKDHKYTTSIPIKNKRETTYAVKTKQNTIKNEKGDPVLAEKSIDLLLKPGSDFFDKKMYVYVLLTLETTDVNYWYSNKKGIKQNYRSRYYYMVDDLNHIDDYFFSIGGLNWIGSKNKGEFTKTGTAPAFKIYNAFEEIKKENAKLKEGEPKKFYIQERLFDDSKKPLEAYGPVRLRGYLVAKNGKDTNNDNNFSSDNTKIHISRVPVVELRKIPNPLPKIQDLKIPSVANNEDISYLSGDIPIQYFITVLASDKPLSYKEIKENMIDITDEKYKGKNIIYNSLGVTDYLIDHLKDDSIKPNENISIYLFGDDKTLSAYVSFETNETDYKEAGYSYYWWGNAKKDEFNQSITSLEPSKTEPFKYYKNLPKKETFIPLFEDLDISKMNNESLNFGFSTGKYTSSDCRSFNTKDGLKTICLPWWRIEREYAEKKEPIADNNFQKWIKNYKINPVGKIVNVCTKVDPLSNQFYNNEKEQKVNCTSYYDKNKNLSCQTNPYQRDCYVDTCPTKVKENCELFKTNDFDNELPALFAKNDIRKDNDSFEKVFSEGKVGLKSYTYKCPAHTNVAINHVCLKEEQVTMNPANCNVNGIPNDEDRINLKSNYIYCPTSNPVIDASGNITGFKGVCPNTKEEVVCGINQIKQVTKTCVVPIFKDEPYTDVSIEEKKANCEIYSIDVGNEDVEDIYKDDPTCLRDNDAADSRKGKLNVEFKNNNVPKTFIISKNYKDTQEIPYCQYEGFKSSKLPSTCKDINSRGGSLMDFNTTITDSKEILFVEQIGALSNSGQIELSLTKFYNAYDEIPILHRDPIDPWNFFQIRKSFLDKTERIKGVYYYHDNLNFSSTKLTGQIDIHPFTLMPEVQNLNYRTPTFIEDIFKIKDHYENENPDSVACRCVSDNCDWLKTSVRIVSGIFSLGFVNAIATAKGFNFKCDYANYAFSVNKVYKNSTLGLNILLPTPSSYEITFLGKENNPLHTQTITRTQLTKNAVGVLSTLALNKDLKTPDQKRIQKLIDEKQKEIDFERERLSKLEPMKKVKLSSQEYYTGNNEKIYDKVNNPDEYKCHCVSNNCDWKPFKKDWSCQIWATHYYYENDRDPKDIAAQKEAIQNEIDRLNAKYEKDKEEAGKKTRECIADVKKDIEFCRVDKNAWFKKNFKFIKSYDSDEFFNDFNSFYLTNTKLYKSDLYGELKFVIKYDGYGSYFDSFIKTKPILKSELQGINNIDCDVIAFATNGAGEKKCKTQFEVSKPKLPSLDVPLREKKENKQFYDRLNNQKVIASYYDDYFNRELKLCLADKNAWFHNNFRFKNSRNFFTLIFESNIFGEIPLSVWDFQYDSVRIDCQNLINNGKKIARKKSSETRNGEVCITKFNPSRVGDPNYNVRVDCSPYETNINLLEDEMKQLQKDMKKASRNCIQDPFSPIGGGTIFGIDSINGGSCELDRGEKFITENAIYSVRIIDTETGDITTKKLEFPLIFPNRIYYTYLKAVEERKYKCCTLLK